MELIVIREIDTSFVELKHYFCGGRLLYFCMMRLHSDFDFPAISLFIWRISSGVKGRHGGVNLSFNQKMPQISSIPRIIMTGITRPPPYCYLPYCLYMQTTVAQPLHHIRTAFSELKIFEPDRAYKHMRLSDPQNKHRKTLY